MFAHGQQLIQILTRRSMHLEMQKRIPHGLELRGRTHPEKLLTIIKDMVHKKIDKKTLMILIKNN